jgi:hypothetical protein
MNMRETALTRDAVLAALARHIGCERGVTARDLVAEAAGLFGRPSDERILRQVIEALRREGEHVCGTPSEGYYLARTPEELDRTCLFLYHRAMTTLTQVAAMKRVSLPDLRGQLRLPT